MSVKRQIALVGGQVVPVYLGIKEHSPDFVHLFYTQESKDKLAHLKAQFNNIQFLEHLVDPFGFQEINDLVEKLVFENDGDQWQLNLTGGTKVMTLAAHNIFKELGLESFYVDQKNRMFLFNQKAFFPIKSQIRITTFLKLSGNSNIREKTLSAYSKEEFEIALKMHELLDDNEVDKLFRQISREVKECKKLTYRSKDPKGGLVIWDDEVLSIKTAKTNEVFFHANAFNICFTGLWWELVVAQTVRKWKHKKEILVGVELLANADVQFSKNEIDIIVNTGNNMIFIECKSGHVKQEDINKMRVVRRLYGGISSRSILVCRKLPRKDVLEKCNDLGVHVFALHKYSGKGKNRQTSISSLSQLNDRLSGLIGRMEV